MRIIQLTLITLLFSLSTAHASFWKAKSNFILTENGQVFSEMETYTQFVVNSNQKAFTVLAYVSDSQSKTVIKYKSVHTKNSDNEFWTVVYQDPQGVEKKTTKALAKIKDGEVVYSKTTSDWGNGKLKETVMEMDTTNQILSYTIKIIRMDTKKVAAQTSGKSTKITKEEFIAGVKSLSKKYPKK